eukprot:TRINITY_DN13638_c0_g1_i1.p1 TRINITY_DN13638_c0_g1~~TRINITY_DN13638_c0_g1_i1.p1  ORF type:complete len:154 (-),score=59.12 TRINITY_DN13638_c0_g1_i1:41-502(-)
MFQRRLNKSLFSPKDIQWKKEGEEGTKSFKQFLQLKELSSGEFSTASPWHDLPLLNANGKRPVFNFVCEIPKGTVEKFEMSRKEKWNPLKQDLDKQGELRIFNYGDTICNYGALPQTWECTSTNDTLTGYPGDDDPVDVLEISRKNVVMRGDV